MLWIDRFRKLPTALIILHVTAKVVFMFGLGVVLAEHLHGAGWWLMGAAVLMGIPGGYKVLSGKSVLGV
jgi:hypothetical protein